MKPQLPTKPTSDADVLAASWVQQLLRCVDWAMSHPQADGRTLRQTDGKMSVVDGLLDYMPPPNPTLIRVYNPTTTAYHQYDAVWLGTLYAGEPPESSNWSPEYSSAVVWTIANPTEDGLAAVLVSELAAGQHGWAMLNGIACSHVYIRDVGDQFARYVGSTYESTVLSSDTWGVARILWRGGDSGRQPCVLWVGDYTVSRPALALGSDGATLHVLQRNSVLTSNGGIGLERGVYEVTIDTTACVRLVFFFRSDLIGTKRLCWVATDCGGSSDAAVTAVSDDAQETMYSFTILGALEQHGRVIAVAEVAGRAAGDAPISARWLIPPSNAVRLDDPLPPMTYDETYRRLSWRDQTLLTPAPDLLVPVNSAYARIYAVGAWGGSPTMAFSASGYDWSFPLGMISTDAAGRPTYFINAAPPYQAVYRYIYEP